MRSTNLLPYLRTYLIKWWMQSGDQIAQSLLIHTGGFRHVQHVQLNRGPHKSSLVQKGWPQTARQLLLQ